MSTKETSQESPTGQQAFRRLIQSKVDRLGSSPSLAENTVHHLNHLIEFAHAKRITAARTLTPQEVREVLENPNAAAYYLNQAGLEPDFLPSC